MSARGSRKTSSRKVIKNAPPATTIPNDFLSLGTLQEEPVEETLLKEPSQEEPSQEGAASEEPSQEKPSQEEPPREEAAREEPVEEQPRPQVPPTPFKLRQQILQLQQENTASQARRDGKSPAEQTAIHRQMAENMKQINRLKRMLNKLENAERIQKINKRGY
jgi:hypothetical protein